MRHPRRLVALVAVAALGLMATACGSDDDAASDTAATDTAATETAATDTTEAPDGTEAPSTEAPSSEAPEATSAPVECTGDPIRVTKIEALTGALELGSRAEDTRNGLDAALHAVNRDCTAGRPIDVIVCDDKSDPNESTACGREAASDGSLAIFGDSGSAGDGAAVSGLPGVLLNGTSLFDLTDPNAFSSTNVALQLLGLASTAAGLGKTNMVFVVPDLPSAQFVGDLAVQYAQSFGLDAQAVFFPADTTDFTALAAQVGGIGADALGVVVPSILPFMTAFEAEGMTPDDIAFIGGIDLLPPDLLAELGGKAEGMYLVSGNVPPSASDDPGIQQMAEDWEAAGIEDDFSQAGTLAVANWSKVHTLATIIGALPPEEIAALTSDSLVAAFIAAGAFEPLAAAPFDFSQQALPDVEALAAFRVFSDSILVAQVTDGQYVVLTGFESVGAPIPLS